MGRRPPVNPELFAVAAQQAVLEIFLDAERDRGGVREPPQDDPGHESSDHPGVGLTRQEVWARARDRGLVMNRAGSGRSNLATDDALVILTQRGVLVKVQTHPFAVWALSPRARAETVGAA
jgi:hypothetical protein